MQKNKIIAFTIADDTNMPYAEKMLSSLRKFHTEAELPVEVIKGDVLNGALARDPMFFYRATPIIAGQLIEKYETVIKLDADQIITSDLNHILEDKDVFDVGTVLNDLPLRVWDVESYYNCGLVVMKNPDFIKHWHRLCYTNHFNNYQYKEQDILSLLTSDYFNYKTKCYDLGERINGLIAKPFWPKCYMDGDKIMLDTPLGKKQLSVIHFAGGNDPNKGNYKIRFKEDVIKRIDELIK